MRNIAMIAVFAILLSFFMYLALNPADFGYHEEGLNFGHPRFTDMDDYFIHNAQNQTGANNVVTSIVFDYRGFDTLGEATVLFTAVLGVGMVLRLLRGDEDDE